MMISDKLYQLAFEYRETKLWQMIYKEQIFAIKLSDGNIGYIRIVSGVDLNPSLSLFIGEKGFNSMRVIQRVSDDSDLCNCTYDDNRMRIVQRDNQTLISPFQFQDAALQQQCLRCTFVEENEMYDDGLKEVCEFLTNKNIKPEGEKPYPKILKYQPYRYAWPLQSEQDKEYMCEALQAAIQLSQLLRTKKLDIHTIGKICNDTKTVPTFELENGEYVLRQSELPKCTKKEYPKPKASNDIGIARLKKVRRSGVWECAVVHYPGSFLENEGEPPVYPAILLAVENVTGYLLTVMPVAHYEDEAERLLNLFMEALLTEEICPREIKVRDELTYEFFRAWGDRLGVAIGTEEQLPALVELEYKYMKHFDKKGEEAEEQEQVSDDVSESDKEESEQNIMESPKEGRKGKSGKVRITVRK